jgi:hypothetical protein
VGWSHHHWLCDVGADEITFVLKPHVIHARPRYYLEAPLASVLEPGERVQTLFWQGGFKYLERLFFVHDELDEYLTAFASRHRAQLAARLPRASTRERIARRLRGS